MSDPEAARSSGQKKYELDWRGAIERGALIDLAEWAEVQELSLPLELPAAITLAVWEAIEAIPFRQIRSTTVTQRVHHVVQRAQLAIERWRMRNSGRAVEAPLALDFGVRLPVSSTLPEWSVLRLHVSRAPQGDAVLMIGFPEERTRACANPPFSVDRRGVCPPERSPAGAPSSAADNAPGSTTLSSPPDGTRLAKRCSRTVAPAR